MTNVYAVYIHTRKTMSYTDSSSPVAQGTKVRYFVTTIST